MRPWCAGRATSAAGVFTGGGTSPEARPLIGGILVGSSIKGMIVGLLSGWFAVKVHSIKWGIAVGASLGLLFALLVALMQKNHYLEIMLPGFVLGGVIGFLTQRLGTPGVPQAIRPEAGRERMR